MRTLRPPDHPAIGPHAQDDAARGTAQRFHPITGHEVRGDAQFLDNARHGVPVQYAGDIVGDRGGGFAAASMRQFGKEVIGERAGDVGEGVAVEEKEGRPAVAGAEIIERFAERGFYEPPLPPLVSDCRKAF